MPWNQDQKTDVFEAYWRSGSAQCPVDRSIIDFQRLHTIGGYLLMASCPKCGSILKMDRTDDPRRAQFRIWTDDERQRLMNTLGERRSGVCPVCGASVEIKPLYVLDSNQLILTCGRCGNSRPASLPNE